MNQCVIQRYCGTIKLTGDERCLRLWHLSRRKEQAAIGMVVLSIAAAVNILTLERSGHPNASQAENAQTTGMHSAGTLNGFIDLYQQHKGQSDQVRAVQYILPLKPRSTQIIWQYSRPKRDCCHMHGYYYYPTAAEQ
jgi:hypothetical protein